MNFDDVISEKIGELELIASWASACNFRSVRDYCRKAQAELKWELKRMQENRLQMESRGK